MSNRLSTDSGRKPAAAARARVIGWSWAAAFGFVVLYLGAVATSAGQSLDDAAMSRLSAVIDSRQWAGLVLHWVSAESLLALTAALTLATWLFRGRVVALIALLTTGTIVVAAQLLKLLLQRPDLLAETAGNSFPSGHVAVVSGLAAGLLVGVGPGAARLVALVVLTPVVGLAGLATVVLQWHRPSDVLGSVLLSVAVAGLAMLLADRGVRRRKRRRVDLARTKSDTVAAMLTPVPRTRVESGMRTRPRG